MTDTYYPYHLPTPEGWAAFTRAELDRGLARCRTDMIAPAAKETPRKTDEVWCTVDEAAKALRLPRATVYRQAKNGKLPAKRIGRFFRIARSVIERAQPSGCEPDGE